MIWFWMSASIYSIYFKVGFFLSILNRCFKRKTFSSCALSGKETSSLAICRWTSSRYALSSSKSNYSSSGGSWLRATSCISLVGRSSSKDLLLCEWFSDSYSMSDSPRLGLLFKSRLSLSFSAFPMNIECTFMVNHTWLERKVAYPGQFATHSSSYS